MDSLFDVISAHKSYKNQREKLLGDSICGCFYCLKIFSPSKIEQWVPYTITAICPYCGVDSVIGESSGYPVTEEFLAKMKEYWF